MAKTLHVDIVSAEEAIFSGEASMVIAPGEAGELGIMPEHTPLITRIKPGTIRVLPAGGGPEEVIYVSGGMMEVQPDVVTVLADTSVRAHDLDEAKALEAKRLAEEALSNRGAAMDVAKAQIELAQAAAQLAAIRKLRKTGRPASCSVENCLVNWQSSFDETPPMVKTWPFLRLPVFFLPLALPDWTSVILVTK